VALHGYRVTLTASRYASPLLRAAVANAQATIQLSVDTMGTGEPAPPDTSVLASVHQSFLGDAVVTRNFSPAYQVELQYLNGRTQELQARDAAVAATHAAAGQVSASTLAQIHGIVAGLQEKLDVAPPKGQTSLPDSVESAQFAAIGEAVGQVHDATAAAVSQINAHKATIDAHKATMEPPMSSAVITGSPESVMQQEATKYGWGSGPQWEALRKIEMAEAGFDPRIANPSSGALGLAQALGHGAPGTAGTLGDEYGGWGLTSEQARLANSGDPANQAVWMMNYIKSRYGTPEAAWSFHLDNGWY
jgi:hypothetical protein